MIHQNDPPLSLTLAPLFIHVFFNLKPPNPLLNLPPPRSNKPTYRLCFRVSVLHHVNQPISYFQELKEGGGWTLLMKSSGASDTFLYDSPHWSKPTSLNPHLVSSDPTADAKVKKPNKQPIHTAKKPIHNFEQPINTSFMSFMSSMSFLVAPTAPPVTPPRSSPRSTAFAHESLWWCGLTSRKREPPGQRGGSPGPSPIQQRSSSSNAPPS